MIADITLTNFNGFRYLEIRPKRITAFVGPNGAGKSSVLQAFGQLKQTVEFPRREPALFMPGPLTSLPGMDAITAHGVAANPTFQFRVNAPLPESGDPFEYHTEFSAEQKPVTPPVTASGLAPIAQGPENSPGSARVHPAFP